MPGLVVHLGLLDENRHPMTNKKRKISKVCVMIKIEAKPGNYEGCDSIPLDITCLAFIAVY